MFVLFSARLNMYMVAYMELKHLLDSLTFLLNESLLMPTCLLSLVQEHETSALWCCVDCFTVL